MVDWRYILSMSIWQEGKYDDILFVDLQIPVCVYNWDAISDE